MSALPDPIWHVSSRSGEACFELLSLFTSLLHFTIQVRSMAPEVTVSYHAGLCRLVIVDVMPDDEGEYTVRAINEAGSCLTSAYLTVLRKYTLARRQTDRQTDQPTDRPTDQWANQQTNRPSHRLTHRPTDPDQRTNQQTNPNRPTHLLTDRPTH